MLPTLSRGRITSLEESIPPDNDKAEDSVGGFPDFLNRRARKSGSAGGFSEFPSLRAGNLLQQLGKPAAGSLKPVHGGTVTRKTRHERLETLHRGPQTRETCQLGGLPTARSTVTRERRSARRKFRCGVQGQEPADPTRLMLRLRRSARSCERAYIHTHAPLFACGVLAGG